jgi:hypothetical protein
VDEQPDIANRRCRCRWRRTIAWIESDAEFFQPAWREAALGGPFVETDQPNVVLLSDALWRRRFGADEKIVGRTIDHTGGRARTRERFEVIGVLPPRFRFTYPDDTELWSAVPWTEVESAPQRALLYNVLARLKEGVGVDAAKIEMAAVVSSMHADYPKVRLRPSCASGSSRCTKWSVGRVPAGGAASSSP